MVHERSKTSDVGHSFNASIDNVSQVILGLTGFLLPIGFITSIVFRLDRKVIIGEIGIDATSYQLEETLRSGQIHMG